MSDSEIIDGNVSSSEDPIFDDIRPCRDDEAQQELAKIAKDEALVDGIVKLRYPKLNKWIGPVLRYFVRSQIKQAVEKVHSIQDFQMQIASLVTRMIETTTDGLTYKGFDALDPNKGYLFISNHRDISLDPAFIDYALHNYGFDTVRIAIGDNLLRIPSATSLMRLNKSFIVKRSVASKREKFREIQHLSHYIGLSLQENHSIWIAQREGRAKDGYDSTEEAVLKMLSMYGRSKDEDFATYMSSLNIVPVSITYEIDPGDCDKAHELYERAKNDGKYQKREFEDIESIVKGIKGYKGRVSVVAGEPITSGFTTPAELAALIDDFIYSHYTLYPSVLVAAVKVGKAPEEVLQDITKEEQDKFLQRINAYPEHLHERIFNMYAAPYVNYQKLMSKNNSSCPFCKDLNDNN